MIPQKSFTRQHSFRKSPLFSGKGRKKTWLQLFAVLLTIAVTWLLSRSDEWADGLLPQPPTESPAIAEQSGTTEEKESSERPLGDLKDLGKDVFESTAGLIYKSGSANGHRIDHVLEHGSDEPGKQVHGVYDPGDRAAVLAVIDEAWMKAKKGGSDVRKQKQNQRTVYTVRMNRKVGFVGGKEGKQQNHPECKNIRIVVEGTADIITAYPVKQF